MKPAHEITQLLMAANRGDADALSRLAAVVYEELRAMAGALLREHPAGDTMRPTALVHEAYLRLTRQQNVDWQDRRHFFCVAAKAMRSILVDYARSRGAAKRGGPSNGRRLPLDEALAVIDTDHTDHADLLALDEALCRLESMDDRKSRVVELRYFAGLTTKEMADVLQVSTATIERDWRMAKAWLYRELEMKGMGSRQ